MFDLYISYATLLCISSYNFFYILVEGHRRKVNGLREGYARSEKCTKPYCPKNGAGLAQLLDQPCPSFEVSFGTGLIESQKIIKYDNEFFLCEKPTRTRLVSVCPANFDPNG